LLSPRGPALGLAVAQPASRFPREEEPDAPKMQLAQSFEGAGAGGDASQVTALLRAGQQKAKVVTIEFDEEEGAAGGGDGGAGAGAGAGTGAGAGSGAGSGAGTGASASAGASAGAGAGGRVADGPRVGGKGSRLSMVRTGLEDVASLGGTPLSTSSTSSTRRASMMMDEPTALLYKTYRRQFLTPAAISSIPILANLSPQDTSSITSLFQLHQVPGTSACACVWVCGSVWVWVAPCDCLHRFHGPSEFGNSALACPAHDHGHTS
jgi:hypothetical protein